VAPAWVDSRLSVAHEHQTRIDPEIWETLARALRANRSLLLLYRKPGSDKPVVRNVDPYHVVRHQGEWYLLAHCHLRDEQRTFAVSRIRRAQMQPRTFVLPEGFDAGRLLENRFGIFGGGDEWGVRIRFSARHAPYVRERVWHPGQAIEEQGDGGVVLSFAASHLYEVMRWVLSWGGGVMVLEPARLAAMVRDELAGALRDYESGSTS